MNNKPDILLFFSDQHNAMYTGFAGNQIVRTPNLDKLAQTGTVFDAAYTSCPLCVPARSSMLTGHLPSKTGIFTNAGTIPSDQATFITMLAAEGYETVLCGRMHFVGEDQRHGFTKRIMGEITPLYWGRGGQKREDLGPYRGTLGMGHCLDIIGGGTSPVLEYDKAVIDAAAAYLQEKHEKPQCLVVGTYAPHFTYVCPPHLFDYYKEKVDMPATMQHDSSPLHPVVAKKEKRVGDTIVKYARAAYYGMIENLDCQIGRVKDAWDSYRQTYNRKGVFIYMSDHGDQAGERYIFGKQTFYEGSSRIPLVFEGEGVMSGKRHKDPVSIMDIGPTVCEIVGCDAPPYQDGKSIWQQIHGGVDDPQRYVISEYVDNHSGHRVPGRMVRYGKWKLISYHTHEEHDELFDLEHDPNEQVNLAPKLPEIKQTLRKMLENDWVPEAIIKNFEIKAEHHAILAKWGAVVETPEPERWEVPGYARALPTVR